MKFKKMSDESLDYFYNETSLNLYSIRDRQKRENELFNFTVKFTIS